MKYALSQREVNNNPAGENNNPTSFNQNLNYVEERHSAIEERKEKFINSQLHCLKYRIMFTYNVMSIVIVKERSTTKWGK